MKNFMNEFKAFVLRGNVLNLAVGIIIGAAFQGIVTSFTQNILSPIIGILVGQDFSALQVKFLGVTLLYGAFITSVFNFIIMAFVVFLIVKGMNKLMSLHEKPPVEEAPTTKNCPYCMTEIDIHATRCPNCTSTLTEG